MRLFTITATLLLAMLASPSSAQTNRAETFGKHVSANMHMGTEFRITLYTPDGSVAKRAFQAAFLRISQLDSALSNYRFDSELNELCRSAPHAELFEVSDDLWKVLSHSQRLARRSKGAFDVTIGPFTKQWRRARRRGVLPTRNQLEQAAALTGHQYLRIDPSRTKVQLMLANMQLDLGAIAKGYAADEALRTLQQFGITKASVDAGGDLALGDPPPGENGWRIALAPLGADAHSGDFVELANAAIATSGDLWQFVEIDGVRYSHIIDPHTGMGLTNRRSATVVAADCMSADALASVLCVLGAKQGIKLVEETPGAAGRLLVNRDDQLRQFYSKRWNERWPSVE